MEIRIAMRKYLEDNLYRASHSLIDLIPLSDRVTKAATKVEFVQTFTRSNLIKFKCFNYNNRYFFNLR